MTDRQYDSVRVVRRVLWFGVVSVVLIAVVALGAVSVLTAEVRDELAAKSDASISALLLTTTGQRHLSHLEASIHDGEESIPDGTLEGLVLTHETLSARTDMDEGTSVAVERFGMAIERLANSSYVTDGDRSDVSVSDARSNIHEADFRLEQILRFEVARLDASRANYEDRQDRDAMLLVLLGLAAALIGAFTVRRIVGYATRAIEARDDQTSLAARRAEGQAILADLSTTAIATHDVGDLRREMSTAIMDRFGFEGVCYWDVVPGGQSVVLIDGSGLRIPEGSESPLNDRGLMAAGVNSDLPVYFDIESAPFGYLPTIFTQQGIRSGVVFRTAGLQDTASLACAISTTRIPFETDDVVWLGAFSDIVSLGAQKIWDESTLAEALAVAEEASASKSRFVAHMSHELRTPLTAVIGYATILGESAGRELTDEEVSFAAEIASSGERLLALINDILDLSRAESPTVDITRSQVVLNELVEGVASDSRLRLKDTTVELFLEAPSQTSIVWTDPVKLRQILVNLVSNAMKYTEDGRIIIRVIIDSDGTPIRLEVEDTGIGIPEDKFDAILRPFEQLDGSYARAWGGTGLGLAITDVLLAQLGYHLEIQSTPGEGSKFTVVLSRNGQMAEATRGDQNRS